MPAALLSGCLSLATLSLHDNPITAEELRETPGYSEFDARRRAKYDKQVGSRMCGCVLLSSHTDHRAQCCLPSQRESGFPGLEFGAALRQ